MPCWYTLWTSMSNMLIYVKFALEKERNWSFVVLSLKHMHTVDLFMDFSPPVPAQNVALIQKVNCDWLKNSLMQHIYEI